MEADRSQIEGVLENLKEGVLAVGAAGEILLVNPAARRILGMGPHVQAGWPFAQAVRFPEIQTVLQEVQKGAGPIARDLALYVPAERHLHLQAVKSPSGILLLLHDVTEFKRLENIRREFVANVSHELKTPLTAIQGAIETLLDGTLEDPAQARPFAESIAEETTRLRRLVDDLLTLAQAETRQAAFSREPIPVKNFLEGEIARHAASARAHQVSLALHLSGTLPALLADRGALAQAISNLLDNAIKYNRAGGRVTVRALEEEGQLRIEVEDTGIGIPPEDLPRIFERFYRVDKARSRETGGTGLGLSIVKQVAESHGGSVDVKSRVGTGSCFTLSIPLQ